MAIGSLGGRVEFWFEIEYEALSPIESKAFIINKLALLQAAL